MALKKVRILHHGAIPFMGGHGPIFNPIPVEEKTIKLLQTLLGKNKIEIVGEEAEQVTPAVEVKADVLEKASEVVETITEPEILVESTEEEEVEVLVQETVNIEDLPAEEEVDEEVEEEVEQEEEATPAPKKKKNKQR